MCLVGAHVERANIAVVAVLITATAILDDRIRAGGVGQTHVGGAHIVVVAPAAVATAVIQTLINAHI